MKRLLLLAALGAAAALPAPAHADHLCVTSNGSEVYCAPHLDKQPKPICVTWGSTTVICVP